jgi:hypothetical protein
VTSLCTHRYDNRGPADTNLLVVRAATDSFPHAIPHFKPQTWYRADNPTRRMTSGKAGAVMVEVESISFRIEWVGGPIDFSAAVLQLVGPAGRSVLLLLP